MSGKVRVTLVRSLIGSTKSQRATVFTLGLRRMHQSVEFPEMNDGLRGAIRKVSHLLNVEEL